MEILTNPTRIPRESEDMPEKENSKTDDSRLAIEEVIRILNREKERKDSLELKASSLLNSVTIVIIILVSVMGFISELKEYYDIYKS